MKNSLEVPQKIKSRTTLWSTNYTFRYVSKENQNANSKRYMHPYVQCSSIYNGQDTEAA